MVSKKDIRFRIYPKKITAYKQIYLTIKMTLNTYSTRSADQLLKKTIFTKSPGKNINFVS